MNLSRYEQETTINFNEEERTASVYTHNAALCRKLDKLAREWAADCRLLRRSHDGRAVEYIVPKCWIKVTPTRKLSEAQRATSMRALETAHLRRADAPRRGDSEANATSEGNDTP